jgi:hypothetical protein
MTMLDQSTARAIVGAMNRTAETAAAPAAPGPVYLMLQAHPVGQQWPDADLDVLVFDQADPEGQIGAYMGDDKDGAIWVNVHGDFIDSVTHWADMPKLTGAALAPVDDASDELATWRARTQRAEGEREVLLSLLLEADQVVSTLEGEDTTEADALEKLRARILRATQPLRPAESGLLGVRAALATRQCSNEEREECEGDECRRRGACQGRYL